MPPADKIKTHRVETRMGVLVVPTDDRKVYSGSEKVYSGSGEVYSGSEKVYAGSRKVWARNETVHVGSAKV